MGAGSTALVWYGLCCCAVAFTAIVASGLMAYGNRAEARRRRAAAAVPAARSLEKEATSDEARTDPPRDGDGSAS